MTFGQNLRFLRKREQLNQKDFATQIGVIATTISNWEVDYAQAPLDKIKLIAAYFNVSADALIYGDSSDFEVDSYYDINDYNVESRQIFHDLTPEEREQLLRTMYNFRIKHNCQKRKTTGLTQQQLTALLLASSDLVLQNLGKYAQRILDTYGEIHDESVNRLLTDTSIYLTDGNEDSNDFKTLLRDALEKVFPVYFFIAAYDSKNTTIEKMTEQFKLDPDFIHYAIDYYLKTKGSTFPYKKSMIDLSAFTKSDRSTAEIKVTSV
ncbi:helix-turn-helix domain-containing protein [Candidatus Enterococcus ikei]|uniref:Helix-turn-helix transcriptional regulator n=1 Tax=Candidatus Enterococcus ikei TaxID=2815326 RepID=A0ABS3H206_9ENTE|nr:helix-turn-helix transcriptional regulator [Enterococcus sp. DIV0869a]MBO0441520.1 helix-turn-helix transcriptional regulator [Enterococcus sp. DIV0869a]